MQHGENERVTALSSVVGGGMAIRYEGRRKRTRSRRRVRALSLSCSSLALMTTRCYIDFAAGDIAIYTAEVEAYEALAGWLTKNGANYGLPAELDELDEVARETLAAVYEGDTKVRLHSLLSMSSAHRCIATDNSHPSILLPTPTSHPPPSSPHPLFILRSNKDCHQLCHPSHRLEIPRVETSTSSSITLRRKQGVPHRSRLRGADG